MSNNTEDFEKLRKLLKLKQHEPPPPGYFNRFSDLVIARIEREGAPKEPWIETPWLRRILRTFESSPLVAGLFGSAICALVIFGITAANQGDKNPERAFSPVASSGLDASAKDSLAFNNSDSHSEVLGRSTDPMFGANVLGSPFGGNGSMARLEPVSFSTTPPQ